MSRFFFPPDVKAVSATEMSITSGGREVSLDAYSMNQFYQESSEEKNPNGEDVTGTLDSLRMDGGYSHTVGPCCARGGDCCVQNGKKMRPWEVRSNNDCQAFKKTTGSKATCRSSSRTNAFIKTAQSPKGCSEAFKKDNFHTNLDGSKCFEKSLIGGPSVKCMYTSNSKQYRPNFSSKTRSLCPGKFIGQMHWPFQNHMQGVAPVSNPNWSWCTGGWTVNTDISQEVNRWVPKFSIPNKLVCRADEYGNTMSCRSKLKLQIFECATCKCAQLVTMTIYHGLELSSDQGACKPWFIHADSGVRAYIAQYRQKLLQQKSKEC